MPKNPRHVRFSCWANGKGYRTGFLIRAGKFLKESKGRLKSDENPWAQDVARIFLKNEDVEEVSIMDKEGRLHAYYRERN